MNTTTRLRKIEVKISKSLEVQKLGAPIIELTSEQKLTWPMNLPYPIFGGLSGQ